MKVTMRNEICNVTLEALVASTPKAFEWSESDEKLILVINAEEGTTLTVKAGNGIQGVNDITLTVPKGVSLIKLESGRFKNVSGENKGKVVIVSAGTPKVGIAALV